MKTKRKHKQFGKGEYILKQAYRLKVRRCLNCKKSMNSRSRINSLRCEKCYKEYYKMKDFWRNFFQ